MPDCVVEVPSRLLDPEVAHFAADDGSPVFFTTWPVGETVVAEAQVGGHPRLQLGHQLRHIEDGLGQKSCVFGREW